MAEAWVSVNGLICTREQAKISVFDHGFLYGDSVYETLRTFGGRPFLVREHLQRLERSGEALLLRKEQTLEELAEQVDRVLDAAHFPESMIRIIWTRGVGDLTYDLDPQQRCTLIVLVRELVDYPQEWYERGIPVSMVDIRRNPVSSLDPRIKTSNLLNPRLAYFKAHQAGSVEAVMLNHGGYLSEGSRTNVFMVSGGRVLTPAVECGILNGITRRLALQLARACGVGTEETFIKPEQFHAADEAFITGTTMCIVPIRSVDGQPVGTGAVGPVTQRLMQACQAFVAAGDWKLTTPPAAHLQV